MKATQSDIILAMMQMANKEERKEDENRPCETER